MSPKLDSDTFFFSFYDVILADIMITYLTLLFFSLDQAYI